MSSVAMPGLLERAASLSIRQGPVGEQLHWDDLLWAITNGVQISEK